MTGRGARDDGAVRARVLALRDVEVSVLGHADADGACPVYAVTTNAEAGDRPAVLLSAGVHGDEPAGVEAALRFLEAGAWRDRFRFFVFPCVNPVGFGADVAGNAAGANINRGFREGTTTLEAGLVIRQLSLWGQRFAFAMDLHEIPPAWADEGFGEEDNPRAAYLYETQADPGLRMGRAMIDALPADLPVCTWPTIYGDRADRGLVSYPEGNLNPVYAEQTTLDGWVQGRWSPHTFTCETPTGWAMEDRVRAHLTWLTTALATSARREEGAR